MIKQEATYCGERDFHRVVEKLNSRGYEVITASAVQCHGSVIIYMVATYRGDE